MSDYQKRLCDFFTECKQDALTELDGNKAYSDWKVKRDELNKSLIALMQPECLEAFKLYEEAVSAMSGIESDYCYMCGMRDYLNIGKQFDKPSGVVWDEFVSHMIPDTVSEDD